MKFVIFHGSFGHPGEHWLPQLKEQLELLGQDVIVPTFPCEDWDEMVKTGPSFVAKKQSLENWYRVFEKEVLPKIKKGEKLCFVGHSLGPVFILHVVLKYNIKLDSAIFVIPFMNRVVTPYWQFDTVNKTFYKSDFDFEKLKKLIPVSYVLYSNNDPYIRPEYPKLFAKRLDSSTILIKQAGHMNAAVNLNEFPLVYELCKSRIDLSLYQRYIEHRHQLFATNYLKGKHEEIIYLRPEEIFDEGLFHFRNLGKKGFCTFYTGLKFWDTQGPYYEEARKAAKRIKDFTRVFVVEKTSDLKRKLLLKQIREDLEAEIKIYLVMLEDIVKDVREWDFGVWDKDYVCVVRFNKEKQVEVKLSSRRTDIGEAEKWENIILKKAVRINNSGKDVIAFIKNHS